MMLRAAAVVCCALALAGPTSAQTLKVAPLPRDGHVLVSFKLAEAFTKEIQDAVHSGLSVSFVYEVDLKRGAALWIDRTIGSAVVTATVRYDNLTRRYHVTRALDGRIERAETTDREDVARDWLTTDFNRLPLFPNIALDLSGEYYVRVRARTTPRGALAGWPWGINGVTALAKFTIVQ